MKNPVALPVIDCNKYIFVIVNKAVSKSFLMIFLYFFNINVNVRTLKVKFPNNAAHILTENE